MAYASETWTGTTGASWGSNWTALFGNGASTIQANAGQLTAGTNTYQLMHFGGMPAVGDTEALITVTPTSVANTMSGIGILGDGVANVNSGFGYAEQNGIAAYVNWNGSSSTIWISQTVSGTETATTHIALGLTPTAGTAYQIRVKRSGLNLYARCWLQSGAEPTTWTVTTTTVSGTPTSGKVFLETGTNTSTFDNLQANFGWINEPWTGTTGASWPSSWTIRGTNGNPGPALATIQTNAGQLKPGASTYSGVRGSLETVTMTSASAVVSATFNVADQYIQLNLNGSGTGSGYNGYYHTPIGIGVELGGGGGLNIYEVPTDGAGSTIGSGSVSALTLNVAYKIRLMTADGQNYSAKVWLASTNEPVAWTITGKASKVYSGFPGVGAQNGNNTNITALLDDFYVIDNSAPGLTLPYTETWTGTTGAAWPSFWTTPIGASNGGGSSSIQTNAGQMISGAAAYNYAQRNLTAMPSIGDTDATVQVTGSVTAVEQYTALWINADPFIDNSNGSSTNAINITLNYNSSVIQLYQGGTQVGSNVTKTLTGTTAYMARVRRFNGTVYARVWAAASAEPATWDFTTALSAFPNTTPVSGVVQLEAQAGAAATARTFTFDNMTVTVPLAMEYWTGTVGAAWPSQWAALIGNTTNGATATIQAGGGRIVSGTGGAYAGARSVLTGINISQTLDVSGTVVMGASAIEQGWDISLADDVTGGGVSPLNGYTLYGYYTAAATTSYLQLLGFSGGVKTVLASSATRTLTGTTAYSFRYQLISGVLQARVWLSTAAEPTTWDITYTIIGTPLTGKLSLGVNQGSASASVSATFSNLLVNGILIPAPVASFTGTPLSGTTPMVVNFSDTTTGAPLSWSWDFGDGTNSTVQNAYHYYPYAGTYGVALTASNGTGGNTLTRASYVSVTGTAPAALTLPFTETWTGTTGAAWPSAWSIVQSAGSGGSATIQANAGRLATGSSAGSYMKAYLATMPSITDTDVLTSFTMNVQQLTYFNIQINADHTQYASNAGEMPQNGYTLNFNGNATAANCAFDMWKMVNGGYTQIYATTTITITAGTKYNVRFQRTGTSIQFRIWAASGGEPATWTASYSDAGTMLGPGRVALTVGNSANQTIDYDDLTVTSLMGSAKVQGASTFSFKPIKVWNGASWAAKPLKSWTGSAWRVIGSNVVPYPFTDDFSTALNTTTKWLASNTTAGATTVGGRLRVTCDSSYEQAGSDFKFDLTQYPVYVQIPTIPAPGAGTTQTQFILQGTTGSSVNFQLQSNPTVISMNITGGPQVSVTYSAVNHVWFRFRIDIGFLLWETSPDKLTWTILRTYGVPSWMTQGNLVFVALNSGYYGAETSPGYAEFDNFNL
jgi:PKD repeat protein